MIIEATPADAPFDEPVKIGLSKFSPREPVTIHLGAGSSPGRSESHAVFLTNESGEIDVSRESPISGSYEGTDAMGLFWSMAPWNFSTELTLMAEVRGETVVSANLTRRLMAPELSTTTVRKDGLVGTLFHHGADPHPGIIVVTGSGGGADELMAAMLASHGYTTLALAYFGVEHLPSDMWDIPVEYFETAIRWMLNCQQVLSEKLAVVGLSRGGELALLLGAMFPEIRAVVGYVPSGVLWPGFRRGYSTEIRAAWTFRGKALPFVAHEPPTREMLLEAGEPVSFTRWFPWSLLDDPSVIEPASIPVERTNGPILLISGKDDQAWPSAHLAQIAMERLARHKFRHQYEHLSYDGAGHLIYFPFTPTTMVEMFHPVSHLVMAFGGSPKANALAQADSWPKVLAFLARHIG
jgi:dienelactone hydrolase